MGGTVCHYHGNNGRAVSPITMATLSGSAFFNPQTDIKKMATQKKKVLFIFDFDNTLVDDNCDTWVMNVVPHLKLQEQVHELMKQFVIWNRLMNYVMKTQFEHGCRPEDVLKNLSEIEMIEPMKKTLERIRGNPLIDAMIVSDCNALFIDTIIKNHNLTDVFTRVYTNPAHFNEAGCVEIKPYHAHCCIRCRRTPNMCKGLVIHSLLEEYRDEYSRIVYVGDGSNDYCAAMHLSPNDHVVARIGYGLAKKIEEGKPPPAAVAVDFTDPHAEVLLQSLMPPSQ